MFVEERGFSFFWWVGGRRKAEGAEVSCIVSRYNQPVTAAGKASDAEDEALVWCYGRRMRVCVFWSINKTRRQLLRLVRLSAHLFRVCFRKIKKYTK